MTRLLLLITLVFAFSGGQAQIQIWLNDGAIINTSNYRIDTASNAVFYLNKKNKTKFLDHSAVFAIIDGQDTIILNKPAGLTTTQAFAFLKGVNDGYHYKNPYIFVSNLTLGLASGITLPMIGMAGVYSVIPSLASTITFGSTNVKDKNIPGQDSLYRQGYRLSARKKRLIIAGEGSIIGLTAGSIIGYIIQNQ